MPSLIDGIGTVSAVKKAASSPAPISTFTPPKTPYLAVRAALDAARMVDLGAPIAQPASSPAIRPVGSTSDTSGLPAETAPSAPGSNPAPTAPVAPTAPTAPSGADERIADPTTFDANTLEEILGALEAKYGLTREQLMAEEGEVGRLYQFVAANLGRMQEQALRSGQEASIGRGILRSGIHLEQQAQTQGQYAEQAALQQGEKARQLAYIRNQLAQLEADLKAETAASAVGFGDEGLAYARERAAV